MCQRRLALKVLFTLVLVVMLRVSEASVNIFANLQKHQIFHCVQDDKTADEVKSGDANFSSL